MVNGEPITTFDIEQRIRLIKISTHKSPPRQEVIEELIGEKVKIGEAKKFGVNPTPTDIDHASQLGLADGDVARTADKIDHLQEFARTRSRRA